MLRRCRLITRDPTLAQDAFQDAYTKLVEHGSNFRKISGKLRWLYTACDRACFSVLKKRGNIKSDGYVVDVLDDVENIGLRVENRESLVTFWMDLDDQEKQIAVLKYVDGLSKDDISETVGLSLETIERKLNRINDKAQALSAGGELE